jgi:hypothetical protein
MNKLYFDYSLALNGITLSSGDPFESTPERPYRNAC